MRIPQKGDVSNAYRWQFDAVLRRLLCLLGAALVVVPAATAASLTRAEGALLARMNASRVAHGLRPLRPDSRLEQAAREHTRAMLAADVFTHGAFGTRMSRFDVRARILGENLAWGTGAAGTASALVSAWLASPEHRANLLGPRFTRVGIADLVGAFEGQPSADVVTADFAG